MAIPFLPLTKFSLITGKKKVWSLENKGIYNKKIQFSYRYVTLNSREGGKKLANWDSWTWFIVGLDPNFLERTLCHWKGPLGSKVCYCRRYCCWWNISIYWALIMPSTSLTWTHLIVTTLQGSERSNNLPKITQLISSWAGSESRFLKAAKAHLPTLKPYGFLLLQEGYKHSTTQF